MGNVDYLKLSEQYASFLVAVGGVSITVLTLVLSLASDAATPTEVKLRSFLVAALMVATVTCFIGAHEMAETASFIQFQKDVKDAPRTDETTVPIEAQKKAIPQQVSGDRLFIIASTNIFIAVILVLFALMLLPTSSGKVDAKSMAPISLVVFLLVVAGAVYWMILAGIHRMPVPKDGPPLWLPVVIVLGWASILYFSPRSESLLYLSVAPSAVATVMSLVWFASIFKEGDPIRLHNARRYDIWFFCVAVSLSYGSLVGAGLKTMLGKQFAAG